MRLVIFALILTATTSAAADSSWKRHTIDNTSRGADGVRLADVNGDGRPDIVTGWEEGGQVRAYRHPGPRGVKREWPRVTVGKVRSPEDAVFVDLDGDGAVDVVSSCEGRTQTVFVHWAPRKPADYLKPAMWKTEPIPVTKNRTRWMFAVPMQVDGRNGIDLIVGSKNPNAQIGWLEAPRNPRDLSGWKWHTLHKAGWIMSLFAIDVDGDGDKDIVLSDRKGARRGCYWLENPGVGKQTQLWKPHAIGGLKREVMFLKPCDLDGDQRQDFVVAVKGGDILFLHRTAGKTPAWTEHSIKMPANVGGGKAVAVGDIDGDGRADVVLSCESAKNKSGVVWLSPPKGKPATDPNWTRHEISGDQRGVKFDRIELLDLDSDGDLDVLTCEERHNLGVIWYENPRMSR